ncbi:S26 family signal peptidase [Stakelama sediminis]
MVRVLTCGSMALAALLIPVVHHPAPRLIWNASASVPIGLYRIERDSAPAVGELVAVRPSPPLARYMDARRYVEAGVLLVKPIAATNGATVCRRGLSVTIDNRAVATALPHDRLGRSLPVWAGCRRLGANDLFLVAPAHKDSFDSRYFGLIESRQVVGRAVPLWTRP